MRFIAALAFAAALAGGAVLAGSAGEAVPAGSAGEATPAGSAGEAVPAGSAAPPLPPRLPPLAAILTASTDREVYVAAHTLTLALRSAAPSHAPAPVLLPAQACSAAGAAPALIILAASPAHAATLARALAACSGGDHLAAALAASAALALASAAKGDASLDMDAHHVSAAPPAANSSTLLLLTGGGAPRSALYAVTAFSRAALGGAYTLGASFVPPAASPTALLPSAAARLAPLPLLASPRFADRGLFPWHDFTMGPDWLDGAAWQAYVQSMGGMGFNTLMLHNYNADDHRGYCPQPIMWYGAAEDIGEGGVVARAYPAWQDTSLNAKDHPAGQNQGWARAATEYDGGAGALFPFDCMGSVLQRGREDRCPYPVDHAAAVSTFAEAAGFFNQTFRAARAVGMSMAAAVGAPLSVQPPKGAVYGSVPGAACGGVPFTYTGQDGLNDCAARCAGLLCTCFDTGGEQPCRITLLGEGVVTHSNATAHPLNVPPPSAAAVQAAYEGMLARAADVYLGGLDALVLWTQIQSTQEDFEAVAAEVPIAQAALTALGMNHVRLATGGWNIGPANNLTYMDGAVGAANVTLSSLMGEEGVLPPVGAFGQLKHGAWTLPWLEGDNGLLRPQLYVQRTLDQAEVAAGYGVRGNLAIHWRVLPCAPAASALEMAGWRGNVSAGQVWSEWVRAAFALEGNSSALGDLVAAFEQLDDSGSKGWSKWVTFDLTQNVPANDTVVEQSEKQLNDTLVPLREVVAGQAIAERTLEYWIAAFNASIHMQRQQLRWRDWEGVWQEIQAAPVGERGALAAGVGVQALRAVVKEYEGVLAALLGAVEAYGDIGVVNDVNQNTYNQGVAAAVAALSEYTSVPEDALPTKGYNGPPHAAAVNVRTIVLEGEAWEVEVWVVAGEAVGSVVVCSGVGGMQCAPMGRVGGGVYRAEVQPPGVDFEAYVVVTVGGVEVVLPPGAPGVPWRVAVV